MSGLEKTGSFWHTVSVPGLESEREPIKPRVTDPVIVPEAPPVSGEPQPAPREFGGPSGPDPSRFGDWERAGRCIDF